MTRHLVTSTRFDFDSFRRRRANDEGPRHVADDLARSLGASIHQPGDVEPGRRDHALSRVIGRPEHWAVARQVVEQADRGDLIYATGEDAGLPIALLNMVRRRQANVAVYFLAPDRARPRTLSELIARSGAPLLAVTGTTDKVELLERRIGSRINGVVLADEQTDTEFFRPAGSARSGEAGRPLVASCGLEQRDYVSLAEAVRPLDVDTKVCAASPNFTDQTRLAMPDTLPDNMEIRLFEFPELRALYQRADVTVISLLPNNYAAGLTVMLEAIACGSPVVITESSGLAHTFIDDDLVLGVPAGNPHAIQHAIRRVLDDPADARDRAERARAYVEARHTSDVYIESLTAHLVDFAADGQVAA